MKVSYKLVMAMKIEQRLAQMGEALKHGFPRFMPRHMDEAASISIACYGPSLADTWQDMQRPIISMSGATHFLAERGVIPDYHIDMDPRKHKTKHIQPPVKGVKYLMATVCPPETWDILKDEDVEIWHVNNGEGTDEWIKRNDPGSYMVTVGSTIGLAAIQIGGMLGYRHFEIHGMDGSIRDGERHAGPHYGHKQGGITWQAGHVVYQTSRIMANACSEVINAFRIYPIFGVFHGTGLQQALIDEEYGLDNVALADTPKANMVRGYQAVFLGNAAQMAA